MKKENSIIWEKCSICSGKCYGTYTENINNINSIVCAKCKKVFVNNRKNDFFDSYTGEKIINFSERLKKFNAGKMNDVMARVFYRQITYPKCSICNREDWYGNPIPLIVDHIDGNSSNNFPNNFRFVCRNCEAFLPTSGSKNRNSGRDSKRRKRQKERDIEIKLFLERQQHKNNKNICLSCGKETKNKSYCSRKCVGLGQRKIEWPVKEQLEQDIKAMSLVSVGRKYGVSDNSIRKWMRDYGIL